MCLKPRLILLARALREHLIELRAAFGSVRQAQAPADALLPVAESLFGERSRSL
jgi:hypothetical protein